MNSLQELNNYGNTTIEYEDERLAKVIFDREVFLDQEEVISTQSLLVTPDFNIEEVINYDIANCRYRITIVSNDPAFISNSNILWTTLPEGVTSSQVNKVYTLSGINNKNTWEGVKTFRWDLPSDYTSYTSWYLKIAVIYFDEELGLEIDREIDFYDVRYYPISKFLSSFEISCNTNYFAASPSPSLTSEFYLDCEAEELIPFADINATTSMAVSVIATKRARINLTSPASMIINARNLVLPMIAQIGRSDSTTTFYKFWKLTSNTYTDISPAFSITSRSGGDRSVFWAKETNYIALHDGYYFYFFKRVGTTIIKLPIEFLMTPVGGPTVSRDILQDASWNKEGTEFSFITNLGRFETLLITDSTYSSYIPPKRLDGSLTSVAWNPNQNILALAQYEYNDPLDLYVKTGSTLSYLNSFPVTNYETGQSTPPRILEMDWNPQGDTLAVVTGNLNLYKFENNKLSLVQNKVTATYVNKVKWSPDGTYVAVSSGSSNSTSDYTGWLEIYKRTGDTFTLLTIPAPTNRIGAMGWDAEGSILSVWYVSLGGAYDGRIDNYNRVGDTFTKTTPALTTGSPLFNGKNALDWRKN